MEQKDELDLLTQGVPTNGVIPRAPVPGDSIAGEESVVKYEVNEPSGQHDPYLPSIDVSQACLYYDTSACTNYGCCHSVGMQCQRHFVKGNLNAAEIETLKKYGFIVGSEFQFLNPQFNAIKSGTQYGVGNYLYKPWDSARHDGMIPYNALPFPERQRQPVPTAAQYYDKNVITPIMEEMAAAFHSIFEVRYEIVPSSSMALVPHLKQAPICINTGCCKPWNTQEVIPACELTRGHCTAAYGYKEGEFVKDLDSYHPNQKRLAWDYNISYSIKGVVYVRRLVNAPVPPPVLRYTWTKKMQLGQRSVDVKMMQDFLKKDGCFPLAVESTGYYGNVTAGAVLKFQLKHKIGNPILQQAEYGHFVGNLTLPVLNKLANQ